MNGVDYSKQLAKDREYFRDANQKTKAAADRRIADNEERSEHVMQKQRDNFIEDRADLEKTHQKALENISQKTQAVLAEKTSKTSNEREKEREAFTQESLKKSKDFDQRLNDIKSSYQKSFESEKDRHTDLEKNQSEKYSRNVKNITADTDKKLADYQDRLTGAGADLKDQYNRERQQIVRAHEDHLTDVHKSNAHKHAELRDRITKDVAKSREVQAQDIEHQRNYFQDRMGTLQDNYENRFDTMARDYSNRNDSLVESQQREAIKSNRETQEKITDIQRDYNKELRFIELEKRRRDNGSGEYADVAKRQSGLKDQIIHENKVKRLTNQLVESQRNYQQRAGEEQDAFNETLKKESTEATARLDKKMNHANADKIVSVAREKEKATKEIDNREHQNRLDKSAYEQQIMLERNNANQRITKLKETFNKSMKELEDKHKSSIEDVTKVSNQDKTEFVKNAQSRRSDEIFAMKREFNKMMDSTVQDYEQRLATYQRENEYLKMSMNQKVANIVDQTEKQIETQRTLFEDRRSADIRDQQVMMDQREATLKAQMLTTNTNFQKKLDKMQITNDTKLKLITNDYENKLKELRATTSRELASKDTNHQIEQDRLKQAYDDEKNRLVAAYENQISGMKAGHKEQMEQMKDFKRLS